MKYYLVQERMHLHAYTLLIIKNIKIINKLFINFNLKYYKVNFKSNSRP